MGVASLKNAMQLTKDRSSGRIEMLRGSKNKKGHLFYLVDTAHAQIALCFNVLDLRKLL